MSIFYEINLRNLLYVINLYKGMQIGNTIISKINRQQNQA